jgi:site-specific DNA-methyltransferase (adenine-specific)
VTPTVYRDGCHVNQVLGAVTDPRRRTVYDPAMGTPASEPAARPAASGAIGAGVAGIALTGVVLADNLEVLRRLPDGCVDLIYIDPPFGTGQRQRLDAIRTGSGARTRVGFAGRSYRWHTVSTHEYRDQMDLGAYLAFLEPRLVEMHRVLAAHGSLYVHLDHHAVHHVRLLLDRIFGPERFLNEIIWAYDYGGRSPDRWPRKHDNILWYARGSTWRFNREAIDRLPYLAPGLVGPAKAERGKLPTDVWWMTIVPTGGRERTGYPTQKPLRLLERIVTASSNPGDLVADFFGGAGTTAVAAARLGRRFLTVDANPEAVRITERRLAELARPPAPLPSRDRRRRRP